MHDAYTYRHSIILSIYFLFTGTFLSWLLSDQDSLCSYINSPEKRKKFKFHLIGLAGANLFLLIYDFIWIFQTVEHYKIKELGHFEALIHKSCLMYDILALISLYDTYRYVSSLSKPARVKSSVQHAKRCKSNVEKRSFLNFWVAMTKYSTVLFSILVFLRSCENTASTYFLKNFNFVITIAVWLGGTIAMLSNVILLVYYLFRPNFKALQKSSATNLNLVIILFFVGLIINSTRVISIQVFEVYSQNLKDHPRETTGAIFLGIYTLCYETKIVIEGKSNIYTMSYIVRKSFNRIYTYAHVYMPYICIAIYIVDVYMLHI